MSEFIPSGAAAVYLGVSRLKIWRMSKAGTLASYPDPLDGRKRLYKREDLEKLKRASSGISQTRGKHT